MGSLIFPPYLQEGDRVIVLSPSSKIDKCFLKGAYKRLKSWGLEVVFAKHAGSSNGTYAGNIRQRLEDLQEAINTAISEATTPTADYLMGMPHLAENLEAGLEALGIDVSGEEEDFL